MDVRALALLQEVGLDLTRKKNVWWLGTLHSAHAVASFSAESSSGRVLNPDIVWNQSVISMVDNTQIGCPFEVLLNGQWRLLSKS